MTTTRPPRNNAQTAAAEQKRDGIIDDAQWLARTGETPEIAARRLGYNSLASMVSRFQKWGRQDILDDLYANAERRGIETVWAKSVS